MPQNALNHEKSQILGLYLKNSGSTKTYQIEGLSTDLKGQDHQEKRHQVLMSDPYNKNCKETPSNPPHKLKILQKIALKITKIEKQERPQTGDKERCQTFHTYEERFFT
jgi:hypothetical protein